MSLFLLQCIVHSLDPAGWINQTTKDLIYTIARAIIERKYTEPAKSKLPKILFTLKCRFYLQFPSVPSISFHPPCKCYFIALNWIKAIDLVNPSLFVVEIKAYYVQFNTDKVFCFKTHVTTVKNKNVTKKVHYSNWTMRFTLLTDILFVTTISGKRK